jgi:hypothetical protein
MSRLQQERFISYEFCCKTLLERDIALQIAAIQQRFLSVSL